MTPHPPQEIPPLASRRRDQLAALLTVAPQAAVWRSMGVFFALGCGAHLLIADAWQWSWLVPNIFVFAGACVVLWRPCALGFAMTLPGLLWPLLFLRDQLTQSVLLFLFGLSALLALTLRPHATWRHAQQTWRMILTSTYMLAALHKLNADFLEPATSCANYGWQEVLDTWQLAWVPTPGAWFFDALPALVIMTEASIALLYLLRLRRVAWALTLIFHIPLTLTMAPAFVFVMLIGHAAWLETEDLTHVRKLYSERAKLGAATLALGLCGAALSLGLVKQWPEWSMVMRETLLWCLLALSLTWGGLSAWRVRAPAHMKVTRFTGLFCLVMWLNGLSPYTGKQVQHAGAMLSNLRVDQGCWNSLVFPESVRLTDDYIRIERVYFRAPGVDPDYEELMRAHLWSPPQLRQMQRNWCAPSRRPFYVEGTWRGERFVVDDLCTMRQLPFQGAGVWGVELFPDAIRFQKNLARDCPQSCIH